MTLNFHTLKHLGVCCLLRRNLAYHDLMGATIALAQLFSFIFSKMNEAGFIRAHYYPQVVLRVGGGQNFRGFSSIPLEIR
jgi:hypothetical protein